MKTKAIDKTKAREQLHSVFEIMQTSVESGDQIDKEKLNSVLSELGEDYSFIEGMIDDADVLNPDREDEFDPVIRSTKIAALKERLPIWIDLIKNNSSAKEMQKKAEENQTKAEGLFKSNMEKILKATKGLEVTANAVDSFFQNASKTKAARSNVYFIKASYDDIRDTKDGACIAMLREEMHNRYYMDDKSDSHSMIVLPGYLGKMTDGMKANTDLPISIVLQEYAKMAYDYHAMFITDYQDVDSIKKLTDEFPKLKLTGPDIWRSAAIMYANWITIRKAHKDYGEKNPPRMGSGMAVAGKIYGNDVSEPAAGATTPGQLSNIPGVTMHVTNDVGTELGKLGINTIRFDGGKFYAGSFFTLHTGETAKEEDKVYTIVMTHQTIHKGIQTIADTIGGKEKLTPTKEQEIKDHITRYLNIQKAKSRIRGFTNVGLIPNPLDRTKVQVQVDITDEVPVDEYKTVIKTVPLSVGTNVPT